MKTPYLITLAALLLILAAFASGYSFGQSRSRYQTAWMAGALIKTDTTNGKVWIYNTKEFRWIGLDDRPGVFVPESK